MITSLVPFGVNVAAVLLEWVFPDNSIAGALVPTAPPIGIVAVAIDVPILGIKLDCGLKFIGTPMILFSTFRIPILRPVVTPVTGIVWLASGTNIPAMILPVIAVVEPGSVNVAMVPSAMVLPTRGMLNAGSPTVPVIGVVTVATGVPIVVVPVVGVKFVGIFNVVVPIVNTPVAGPVVAVKGKV